VTAAGLGEARAKSLDWSHRPAEAGPYSELALTVDDC